MHPEHANRAACRLSCSALLGLMVAAAPALAQRHTVQELGTLGGYNYGVGISADIKVGGYSYTAPGYGGVAHAFLWEDGGMQRLTDLLPEAHGWYLIAATSINDDGYITGYGTNPEGVAQVAFLLTPIIVGGLNGDGCVDQGDLGILLADWGCTGGDCPGDYDDDGDTDHSDLGILLTHWGEGCP